MEYLSQVCLLSLKFMRDYPATTYPEILHKLERPYACLLVDSHDGYFICVPFRSSISHNNAFLFKATSRSKRSRSGIDYTKTIIINNLEYIDSADATIINQNEYTEMTINMQRIVTEVLAYVDTYINHVSGVAPLHPRQFSRRYGYSTLPYFHDILGLDIPPSES